MTESGALPDTKAGGRRYVAYLGVLAEEDVGRRKEKFGRLSRGWVIGSSKFQAELKKELLLQGADRERFELLGGDRDAAQDIRAEGCELLLRTAAEAGGINLAKLPAKKSAQEKVMLAALLRARSSAPNAWIARRLEMGASASVSQFVRRFLQRSDKPEPGICSRMLSNIST